jgi:ABC-2 type transport system permease protein
MQVGSLPWLLRHELRLWWRDVQSRPGLIIWSIILGLLASGVFLLFWLAFSGLRDSTRTMDLTNLPFWTAVIFWLLGLLYGFIQAMQQSIFALFDRGDLDLLVSSPVSSQVIFASRLIGVALRICLNYCPIVVPASLVAVAIGLPQLLGIYPALVGLALAVASVAMLVTLWLVGWLGARRARTAAQVFTALLSALLFLGSQLPNLLRGTGIENHRSLHWLQNWFTADGWLSATSPIWFPVRAMFFDLPSVLLTVLVSAGLAWLAVETLHRSFVSGAQESVTQKQRQLRPEQETTFSGGFNRVVLLKEWRIIWRNPYLLSATFLQVLFLIPALVIVLRDGRGTIASLSTFVSLTSIVIGESLTQTLVRICVSGEEAPDLLKSAPIAGAVLRRLKLLAALIPVWVVLSPLFLLLMLRGDRWFTPLMIFLAATTCAALLRLWNSQPIRLADIGKRQQTAQGDLVLNIAEGIALFTWAWLGYAASTGMVGLAIFPIALLVLVVAIAYWRSEQLGTSLGF